MNRKIEIECVGARYSLTGYVRLANGWTGAMLKTTGFQASAMQTAKEFFDTSDEDAYRLISRAGVQIVGSVEQGDKR